MYEHNMKKIFLGEYIKDIDKIVLPQDPLLANKFPTPIMERAACGGIWEALEESEKEKGPFGLVDHTDFLIKQEVSL